MMPEVNTFNDQCVAVQGGEVLVGQPKLRMTTEAALRQAAWLVAMAQTQDDYEEGQWDRKLDAVLNT